MDASPVLPPAAVDLGISFDGRTYHYREYSYEKLEDAFGYARLDRGSPTFREEETPRRWKQWVGPTPEDRLQMAAHGIVYERGHYLYGPYRYDLLSAALEYAKHEPGLARPPGRDER